MPQVPLLLLMEGARENFGTSIRSDHWTARWKIDRVGVVVDKGSDKVVRSRDSTNGKKGAEQQGRVGRRPRLGYDNGMRGNS
ncbi:hypothetical protein BHE74_00048756 [Ensete ventricosum]|nr:hypothetical protein GW17_00041548 [Ensete ventricosum]RWW45409.1 hypothetical protein BHE74_00048756 [Ensete ventricosum]RZS09911.1 hypothetical protein BHM03_00041049 [Ensete ventricosum]